MPSLLEKKEERNLNFGRSFENLIMHDTREKHMHRHTHVHIFKRKINITYSKLFGSRTLSHYVLYFMSFTEIRIYMYLCMVRYLCLYNCVKYWALWRIGVSIFVWLKHVNTVSKDAWDNPAVSLSPSYVIFLCVDSQFFYSLCNRLTCDTQMLAHWK